MTKCNIYNNPFVRADHMKTIEGSRELFERRFPVPEGLVAVVTAHGFYYHEKATGHALSIECQQYNAAAKGWQARGEA